MHYPYPSTIHPKETHNLGRWTPYSLRVRFIQRYLKEYKSLIYYPITVQSFFNKEKFMSKFSDWAFVNVPLSVADKPALDFFIEEQGGDSNLIIQELTAQQYKISIAWVDSRNSFCVTMSGGRDHPRNPAQSMSAWSDDINEAVWMLGYKHLQICKSGEWKDFETSAAWG